MCARAITLVACARTSTLACGVTLPVASSVTGTSRTWARTRLTLTGGAEAAALGPEAAPLAALAALAMLATLVPAVAVAAGPEAADAAVVPAGLSLQAANRPNKAPLQKTAAM